jgi:hypothetical protein
MLRIPHCLDSRLTYGGKVVSPTLRPRFIPQKHYFSVSGTHFESRTCDLPAFCSVLTTTLPRTPTCNRDTVFTEVGSGYLVSVQIEPNSFPPL